MAQFKELYQKFLYWLRKKSNLLKIVQSKSNLEKITQFC